MVQRQRRGIREDRSGTRRLPIVKSPAEPIRHCGWEFDRGARADCFYCCAHLIQIGFTARTDGQVLIEADPVNLRQPSFEVVRYQLGQFLAGEFLALHDFPLGAAHYHGQRAATSKSDFQE